MQGEQRMVLMMFGEPAVPDGGIRRPRAGTIFRSSFAIDEHAARSKLQAFQNRLSGLVVMTVHQVMLIKSIDDGRRASTGPRCASQCDRLAKRIDRIPFQIPFREQLDDIPIRCRIDRRIDARVVATISTDCDRLRCGAGYGNAGKEKRQGGDSRVHGESPSGSRGGRSFRL